LQESFVTFQLCSKIAELPKESLDVSCCSIRSHPLGHLLPLPIAIRTPDASILATKADRTVSATFSLLLLAVFAGPTDSTAARPANGLRVSRDRDLSIRLVAGGQVVTAREGDLREVEFSRLCVGGDTRVVVEQRRFVFSLVRWVFAIHPARREGERCARNTSRKPQNMVDKKLSL
jgi:hypothetical protein